MQPMISFQISEPFARKIAEVYQTPEVELEPDNEFEREIFAAIKQTIWGEDGNSYQLPHVFSEFSTEPARTKYIEKAKSLITLRLKSYIFSATCEAGRIEFAMKNISLSRSGKLKLKAKAAKTDQSHLKVLTSIFIGMINQLSEHRFDVAEINNIPIENGVRISFKCGDTAQEIFTGLDEMSANKDCLRKGLRAKRYRDVMNAQEEWLNTAAAVAFQPKAEVSEPAEIVAPAIPIARSIDPILKTIEMITKEYGVFIPSEAYKQRIQQAYDTEKEELRLRSATTLQYEMCLPQLRASIAGKEINRCIAGLVANKSLIAFKPPGEELEPFSNARIIVDAVNKAYLTYCQLVENHPLFQSEKYRSDDVHARVLSYFQRMVTQAVVKLSDEEKHAGIDFCTKYVGVQLAQKILALPDSEELQRIIFHKRPRSDEDADEESDLNYDREVETTPRTKRQKTLPPESIVAKPPVYPMPIPIHQPYGMAMPMMMPSPPFSPYGMPMPHMAAWRRPAPFFIPGRASVTSGQAPIAPQTQLFPPADRVYNPASFFAATVPAPAAEETQAEQRTPEVDDAVTSLLNMAARTG